MATSRFRIEGMSCEHCVAAVDHEVRAVPGVTAVQVDLAHAAATVTASGAVDRAAVSEAVRAAGYAVTS